MDEQAKRFQERNEDFRKIWKLSPMDLQAQARWYDYSRARDAMFAATDTPGMPLVRGAIRTTSGAARLNCISHLLSLIPYTDVPREEIKFPKRQEKGDYVEPNYPYRYRPTKILIEGDSKLWQIHLQTNRNGIPCRRKRLANSFRSTRPRA